MDKERCAGEAGSTVLTWHLQRCRLGGRLGVISGRSLLRRDGADLGGIASTGRRRDNVPKGGRMRARGCGYVVGQAETKR